jgi:transposase
MNTKHNSFIQFIVYNLQIDLVHADVEHVIDQQIFKALNPKNIRNKKCNFILYST